MQESGVEKLRMNGVEVQNACSGTAKGKQGGMQSSVNDHQTAIEKWEPYLLFWLTEN